ncbi:helix-turn-helix transcriptional regulator [Halomonas ramblicola]|uniref:helix-turn-helix transcriptional regulator n=1 Tax=Halomonas ramblicola TaxID=747349 RepID=UPI0025B458EA|nr:AraC family transcriptional regulator [Halomonas ramblicola]MDN3523491.1 AraC family transcriptional regulator [Halomonas ramblicola]
MSSAHRILHGGFGRVALLDMDESLVPHAHSECHVLLKVSGEDTYFSVRDRRLPLTDRTAVLINAWEPHFYDHQHGAADTLILALYIEPSWLAALQNSLALSGRPDFFSNPCIELTPRLRHLVDQLIAALLSFGLVPQDKLEALLFDLLIEITEKHSDLHHLSRLRVGVASDFYDARVRRASQLILEHPQGEVDMAAIAQQCGLSRAHFFSLFKKNTGMTPQMYANIGKMQMAFRRLSDNRYGTLGNLSESLGFSEQGHFTRFFRRHIGASPSQYQKAIDDYSARAS